MLRYLREVCMDVFPEHLVNEVEIALIARADNHSRCYGMLNWGDSIDMGYTLQGRGGGKPEMTQGSLKGKEVEIRTFIQAEADA